MKIKKFLTATAMAALLAACVPTTSTHIRQDGVTDSSTYPEYVQDIRYRTNTNGLLDVQIAFQSPRTRTIHYKIEWLDQDGFALRNPIDERYRALRLTRNEEFVLHKLASDTRAREVKVYIK